MEHVYTGIGYGADEFGNKVKNPKHLFPYSYDPFVIWACLEIVKPNDTIYSDRLLQWDYEKYNSLSKKHFGNDGHTWLGRSPESIEAFLKDWTDDPKLKLVNIVEGCNRSTGYSFWRFNFHSSKT